MSRSAGMIRLQAQLAAAVRRETINVTLNIRNMLIADPPQGTPIDTGFASNNWWFEVGRPAPSPRTPTVGGEARMAADTVAIQSITIDGSTMHLTNNAQYIGLLNDGSSSQTPQGFVERAILTEQFASRNRVIG